MNVVPVLGILLLVVGYAIMSHKSLMSPPEHHILPCRDPLRMSLRLRPQRKHPQWGQIQNLSPQPHGWSLYLDQRHVNQIHGRVCHGQG
jgi:hypothetical protein